MGHPKEVWIQSQIKMGGSQSNAIHQGRMLKSILPLTVLI